MYGRAFRAPNYLELYDRNNPVDYGNPTLDPEVIDTLEVAYVQKLKDELQLTITYFNSTLRDAVQFGIESDDPGNVLGVPSFENRGTLTFQGVEGELRTTPLSGFDILGTFAYIWGDVETFPNASGSLVLNYNVGGLNLNVSAVARGKTKALADQRAYALVNARVEYEFLDDCSVYLNGRNLLGQEYMTVSSVIPVGIPNRRRMLMGGLIFEM